MKTELLEVYDHSTNAVVIRYTTRKYPGVLVQGDTLYALSASADRLCRAIRPIADEETFQELNQLRNSLASLLAHYKSVLVDHSLPVPFSEDQPLR